MTLSNSAETLSNAYDGRTGGEKVEICVLVANQVHIGMPGFKGVLEAKIIHRIQDTRNDGEKVVGAGSGCQKEISLCPAHSGGAFYYYY